MRKFWTYNKELYTRTSVSINPTTGKIEMPATWWKDRKAEFSKHSRFITWLQNTPLPFKDILDQIFGEHDVEQDDRYSPYMLGINLNQIDNGEADDDNVSPGETEGGPSLYPNIAAFDDDFPSLS